MTKSLADIAEAMKDIDFCMLVTHAPDGSLGGRPMSNNREVAYEGTSSFFTLDNSQMVQDIASDSAVGVTYQGKAGLKGLLGAPGMFIHVNGDARLIRDKAAFAAHWNSDLDSWFEQGVDTPGMVLIEVAANRIHYWDGHDEGEVLVSNMAPA